MRDHRLSGGRSDFGHFAAILRGSLFGGCMLGAVLFIWSATSLRHDIAVPGMARTVAQAPLSLPTLRQMPRIVTFADLSRDLPRAPARDVIRLAVQ